MNVWMKKEWFHFAALKNIWFQLGFTEKSVDGVFSRFRNCKEFWVKIKLWTVTLVIYQIFYLCRNT